MRLPNWRQESSTFAGQQGVTTGWGRIADGTNALSPELRFVRTQIITNLSCTLSWPLSIQSNHLCASGATDMQAPCPGDNGGPMTVTDAQGRTFQVGVLSFMSILGCQAGRPAVYTRVSQYLQWIQDNSDITIADDF
jgi:secreted trypsin-like serine protease